MDRYRLVDLVLLLGMTAAGVHAAQAPSATGQKPQTPAARAVERTKPPETSEPAGEFTIRRLDAPLPVDGRTWIATKQVSTAGTLTAPNRQFTLALEEASSNDVVRFRIFFTQAGSQRVQLDAGRAVYAFVTPDSRWIIFDPLEVVDVTNWRRYSLSRAFNVDSYVVLRAMSSDGRRLFVSRKNCPFDCQNIPDEYYEIGLPARTGGL
jgi:hypothetical protein